VLQESSTLNSYLRIQRWICNTCIMLLGRGLSICDVQHLSTIMQPHTLYTETHKWLFHSFNWELKDNQTYSADLAHQIVLCLGQWSNTLEVSDSAAIRMQESDVCHDWIVKTMPSWDTCIGVLWDCVEK
jgi:hypothetical protein